MKAGRVVESVHYVRVGGRVFDEGLERMCDVPVRITLEVPAGHTVRSLGMKRGDPKTPGGGSVVVELQVDPQEDGA